MKEASNRNKQKIIFTKKVNSTPDQHYETSSFLSRIWQFPVKILLSALPAFLARRIFLAGSKENSDRKILHLNVGTYIALEILYSYPERKRRKLTNKLDDFWDSFLWNAMAVRNRLKLVKRILRGLIEEYNEGVNIASIGCGSSRSVIEVINSLNAKMPINLYLIDIDQNALEFSKKLTCNSEEIYQIHYIRGTVSYLSENSMDIIEMVGLLDYFLDPTVIKLIKSAHKALKPNGYLVTGNIIPNLEKSFITKGVGWKMIYRYPYQLAELICKSEFLPENINLFLEPLGIHCIAVCKK